MRYVMEEQLMTIMKIGLKVCISGEKRSANKEIFMRERRRLIPEG